MRADWILVGALLAVTTPCVVAASSAADGSVDTRPRADVGSTLADDRGRSIPIAPRAGRIASLSPHTTDLLLALGVADTLVAVDTHSDVPGRDTPLPRIASYPSINPERLLALKPDLVLVWGEGLSSPTLARLESLGLRVFISTPRTADDVASSLERLGDLIGVAEVARAAAQNFRLRAAELTGRFAQRPVLPVFVQLWETPLITSGAGSLIDDALGRCGAKNVLAAKQVGSHRVSPEAVIAAAPALVISTVPGSTDAGWRRLGLVGDAHGAARFVRVVDPMLERPSPPVLDAIERLCRVIDAHRPTGDQQPVRPAG